MGEEHHHRSEFASVAGEQTAIRPYGGGRVPNRALGGVNWRAIGCGIGNSSLDRHHCRGTTVTVAGCCHLANTGTYYLNLFIIPHIPCKSFIRRAPGIGAPG